MLIPSAKLFHWYFLINFLLRLFSVYFTGTSYWLCAFLFPLCDSAAHHWFWIWTFKCACSYHQRSFHPSCCFSIISSPKRWLLGPSEPLVNKHVNEFASASRRLILFVYSHYLVAAVFISTSQCSTVSFTPAAPPAASNLLFSVVLPEWCYYCCCRQQRS